MSIHVAKKLTVNNFSSSQERSSFNKYSSQLAKVNGDKRINLICFDHDAVHVSLI